VENESNGSVQASQPGSRFDISMLMTDLTVGAAPFAPASALRIGAPDRDERRRAYARLSAVPAQGAGPRARISPLLLENSAQVRSAFDPRPGTATDFTFIDQSISIGASAVDAGTAYGPVRYQEHPPAA
jgi:hypothetical protein